ncbi:MAG: S9 family peptidase [Acidibacillus sp.]|nr:S9 family peptidase [Acidibacillus sp.]
MKKTLLQREDLYQFEWIGAPRITPDGERVVYTLKTVTKDHKGYKSRMAVVDLRTDQIRMFTQGEHKDRLVDVTNDEMVILSDRVSGEQQVFLLPFTGGEARQVSAVKGGVRMAKMAPDRNHMALLVQLKSDEKVAIVDTQMVAATAGGSPTSKEKDAILPYEVHRLHYKADGSGLWDQKTSQLVWLEIATGKVTQLTDGEVAISDFSFSPDGTKIVYSSQSKLDDRNFFSDIYTLELATQEKTCLTDGTRALYAPVYAPDGQSIAVFGHDMKFQGATQQTLYLIDNEKQIRPLVSEQFPYGLSADGMSDMRGHESVPGPLFTSDGRAVIAPYSAHGAVALAMFTVDGVHKTLVEGEREIYSFDFCAKTGDLVFVATDPTCPNDLFVRSLHGGAERRLTMTNAWLAEKELATVTTFTAVAKDGQALQGFKVTPPVPSVGTGLQPVILEVHGGPHAMYSHSFVFEFQLLAALGFVVIYGNPRGSSGYGQAFVDACRGDYGGKDYEDLLSLLDHALEQDVTLDATRIGVTGGSYGGFMTNWIVGHTNRFKAAVTQRSISNWISFHGVSDIGYFFTEWEMKWSSYETPWTDIEKLWEHSPMKYVSNVETPLLILHGEEDFRCPIEQAEQLYVALKMLDKEVSFIRFPKSSHDLSRTGIPSLRVERYRYMSEWFVRYV